jgi:hypothetical protein
MERRELYRPKRGDPDIEDKFDEMIQEQMKEIGYTKSVASVPVIETGGYSDIDLMFERK